MEQDKPSDVNEYVNQHTDLVINNLHQTILLLLEKDAKKIVITNCSVAEPLFISNEDSKVDLVQLYNDKLQLKIDQLQSSFLSMVKIYDIYQSFRNIKQEFAKTNKNINGAFSVNFKKIALGSIFNENCESEILNEKNESEIDQYFYLDTSHPTKLVHKTIGEQIYQFIINWG